MGFRFASMGIGVDVVDPQTKQTLGTIRVGGGNYVAVHMEFGQYELCIVGAEGIWHVIGIRETLVDDEV